MNINSTNFYLVLATVIFAFSPGLTFGQIGDDNRGQVESQDNQQIMRELLFITRQPLRRRELELTPDQVVELSAIGEEYSKELLKLRAKYREDIAESQKLFAAGKHTEAQELLFGAKEPANKIAKQYLTSFEKVLLPHQMNRARQISMQESFKRMNKGSNEFGIFLLAAHKLNLSEEAKATMRDKILKENQEFYRQVEILREQARKRIAETIPAAKKVQFEEMIGDFYDSGASRRESIRHKQGEKDEQGATQSDK